MPIGDRDYIRGLHLSSCTCADCCTKRLKRLRKEAHPDYVSVCPRCGKKSLWHNVKEHKYECLNLDCKAVLYPPIKRSKLYIGYKTTGYMTEGETDRAAFLAAERQHREAAPKTFATYNKPRTKKRKGLPGCLVFFLVVFSLSILGFGLYYLCSTHFTPITTQTVPPQTVATPPPTQESSKVLPPPQEPKTPNSHSGRVWIDSNTYLVGGDWSPIILIDNPNASNPTLEQLLNFLRSDQTDMESYTPTHVCADFAEEVHNRAEQQGIKAAFVVLTGVDHALNAFQTTDAGLVFVDCTGENGLFIHAVAPPGSVSFGETTSWDKIAYIQLGSPLGFISLDSAAKYYGFSYSGCENWRRDETLFDTKLNTYNQQVGGRVFVSEAEYYQLQGELRELEELDKRLGACWDEIGVVQNFQIFWEGK